MLGFLKRTTIISSLLNYNLIDRIFNRNQNSPYHLHRILSFGKILLYQLNFVVYQLLIKSLNATMVQYSIICQLQRFQIWFL